MKEWHKIALKKIGYWVKELLLFILIVGGGNFIFWYNVKDGVGFEGIVYLFMSAYLYPGLYVALRIAIPMFIDHCKSEAG
jgi:hypothetical protein